MNIINIQISTTKNVAETLDAALRGLERFEVSEFDGQVWLEENVTEQTRAEHGKRFEVITRLAYEPEQIIPFTQERDYAGPHKHGYCLEDASGEVVKVVKRKPIANMARISNVPAGVQFVSPVLGITA